MTKNEVEEIVARVVENKVVPGYAEHFWVQMRKRFPRIKAPHIYKIFQLGQVFGKPVADPVYNNYKAKIRADVEDLGNVEMVIGTANENNVTCITIYGIERG